jgi:hypothetical protein
VAEDLGSSIGSGVLRVRAAERSLRLVPADPRIGQYARVLVEQCLDIQPRQQVLLDAGVPRPAARRGDRFACSPGRALG